MEIRIATFEDCRALAELHVHVWQHAYRGVLPKHYLAALSVSEREAMWRRMVELEPGQLLVACAAGEVVGFVAFGASRDEEAPIDRAEIFAIYVNVACWSMGAGRLLWQQARQRIMEEGYKSVSLWVLANNERALRFYERAGFAVDPQSRKPFELGDAIVEELRYVRRVG